MFDSERWDINKIINDSSENDLYRIKSLALLWIGRANDIQDRNNELTPQQRAQIDALRQCATDLIQAVETIEVSQ
jgi:hypothetical protein